MLTEKMLLNLEDELTKNGTHLLDLMVNAKVVASFFYDSTARQEQNGTEE